MMTSRELRKEIRRLEAKVEALRRLGAALQARETELFQALHEASQQYVQKDSCGKVVKTTAELASEAMKRIGKMPKPEWP